MERVRSVLRNASEKGNVIKVLVEGNTDVKNNSVPISIFLKAARDLLMMYTTIIGTVDRTAIFHPKEGSEGILDKFLGFYKPNKPMKSFYNREEMDRWLSQERAEW
jgi:hypothetical protein